jgi:hypothetical protein
MSDEITRFLQISYGVLSANPSGSYSSPGSTYLSLHSEPLPQLSASTSSCSTTVCVAFSLMFRIPQNGERIASKRWFVWKHPITGDGCLIQSTPKARAGSGHGVLVSFLFLIEIWSGKVKKIRSGLVQVHRRSKINHTSVRGDALMVFVAELRCWTPQRYSEWMHPGGR